MWTFTQATVDYNASCSSSFTRKDSQHGALWSSLGQTSIVHALYGVVGTQDKPQCHKIKMVWCSNLQNHNTPSYCLVKNGKTTFPTHKCKLLQKPYTYWLPWKATSNQNANPWRDPLVRSVNLIGISILQKQGIIIVLLQDVRHFSQAKITLVQTRLSPS